MSEHASPAVRFMDHAEHRWRQVGTSVLCEPCNVRLYTGQIPATFDAQKLFCAEMDRAVHDAVRRARGGGS